MVKWIEKSDQKDPQMHDQFPSKSWVLSIHIKRQQKNHSVVFIWNFYLMSTRSNIQFPWGRAAGFGQLLPEEQLFIFKKI